MIDAMHKGDKDIIVKCIMSSNPLLQLNAIWAGTKTGLHDDIFIEGVKNAEASNEILLGCPIRKFATASLHLLEIRKYSGTDAQIKSMIRAMIE